MSQQYFSDQSFKFLDALADNNEREWFNEHKPDYEQYVREPALALIADVGQVLHTISPHFVAVPKKVGGSLMRVQRDVRFGHDKRPYKTNIGIQFRHELGKNIHAPGFYLHIACDECFVGVGMWRPDSAALGKVRTAIVERADAWRQLVAEPVFSKHFEWHGDRLKNPPRGYPKDHPLVEDLKWKDFIALKPVTRKTIASKQLLPKLMQSFEEGDGLMRFLCEALTLRY